MEAREETEMFSLHVCGQLSKLPFAEVQSKLFPVAVQAPRHLPKSHSLLPSDSASLLRACTPLSRGLASATSPAEATSPRMLAAGPPLQVSAHEAPAQRSLLDPTPTPRRCLCPSSVLRPSALCPSELWSPFGITLGVDSFPCSLPDSLLRLSAP